MSKTAYLFNELFMEHDTGPGHPERAARLDAIDKKIRKNSFYNDLVLVEPVIPLMKYIEMIHAKKYILRVEEQIKNGIQYLDSMDTSVSEKSFDVALHAVGGCLNMCDTVMKDMAQCGFCVVRPPGHHAEKNRAAGFCIFNNIAISARYLQSLHGIKKVAIIDWDVHHGNGTQHSFEQDNSVFYISLHQFPHYPGTGAKDETGLGSGKGYTLNLPMKSGSRDEDYMEAFDKRIIPALDEFKPEILLISAGFDAHRFDPLSSINLSSEAYYEFTKKLKEIAGKYSQGRTIAFLEGGYDLPALADGVSMVLQAFIED